MKTNLKVAQSVAATPRAEDLKVRAQKAAPMIDMLSGEGVGLYISVSEV